MALKPAIAIVSLILATATPAVSAPVFPPVGFHTSASADDLRLEQVFPMLAGKNQVRWYPFNWKQTEFRPAEKGAPVRLYFYESERKVAELATALISEAYLDLAGQFDYAPAYTIPFLLYNSHFEFESTRAFFVSEQVLGVTSTEDLKMAIPYWGEHQRFIEVMRHELAHQFTIQKVWSNAQDADCNPLQYLPLWFVEGLAQYYALHKLTPDVRAVMVERILHPHGDQKLPDFFTDTELSFERIYLIGHAQVTFLDETFGNGTLQKILKRSPELCSRRSFFGSSVDTAGEPFEQLLSAITGSDSKTVKKLWKEWAAAVAAPGRTAQTPPGEVKLLAHLGDGQPDSFALSPDGKTIFYRTLDFDTGVARLFLRDLNDADSRRQLAADQSLGLVSLHPLDRRVTAVGSATLAYIGRVGPTDVLFVRKYRRVAEGGRVRFELGDAVEHPLDRYDALIEGGHPAIDPTTGAVAFVGLNRRTGTLDVYELAEPFKESSPLRRLSDDPYAEQGLAYDADGRLYLTSDATYGGHYEVMRLEGGRKTQLTNLAGDADAVTPMPVTSGVLYQSGASGFAQTYLHRDGQDVRLTDVETFWLSPAFDADGNLYGITLRKGERHLGRIDRSYLLALAVTAPAAPPPVANEAPWPLPRGTLTGVRDYSATKLSNYGLVGAQAAAALGSVAAGTIVFSDLFNTNVIGVSAFYAGQADLGEFVVAYLNHSRRLGLGGSVFLTNGLQLENPDGERDLVHTFLLQRFGASFDTEYPLSRYMRLTASFAPQRLRAYRFSNPGGAYAQKYRMSAFAVEARTGFAIDTTRLSLFGPVRGQSWVVAAEGTMTGGAADPFGDLVTDYQFYYPFIGSYERWIGSLRLAGGTSAGGAFREQFYVPAAYNLRTISEGSLELFGEHYYLGQLETQFPLSPVIGNTLYLQGVAGADLGAVNFNVNEAWSRRRAAWVTGANLGLGPVIVRFHFARPFDVGGDPPAKNLWLSYLSIMLSPLAFAQ